MRYTSDDHRRYAFRDWLRSELVRLEFYQRRGDRYLVSEFARYADQLGAHVEEVSLGRYLRDENPVLPTPESCRELARALGRHPAEVLLEAGYLTPDDFFYMPSAGVSPEELTRRLQEIDQYTYLPDAIRAQMKASLEHQLRLLEQLQPKPGLVPAGDGSSNVVPMRPDISDQEQTQRATPSGTGRDSRPADRR
jgi:hypothetical protein